MTIENKSCYPVKIAGLKLYCDNVKITAETVLKETASVTGDTEITNSFRRLTRMSFSGRTYNPAAPMLLASYSDNINGTGNVEITYRGMKFRKCTVTGYTAEDCGEKYISLTVNAVSEAGTVIVTEGLYADENNS